MSTRRNNGSHYENHQRAAELQDAPAHAHRVAELTGRADHLTPGELSRQERQLAEQEHAGGGAPLTTFGHEDIARRAYQLWEDRGHADGAADEDWFQAVRELRQQVIASKSAKVH
ncbi:MAG TPA: DUF2934 domain-containing protein [Bryobacteraceae bacterium]|nr:DUF2934 domain-containing protein [Bryobacteraceae bacterium]